MNPFRKLLVIVINDLVEHQLICLGNCDQIASFDHVMHIAGSTALISCGSIGFGELSVRVKWRGIEVLGWIERQDGVWLQGKGRSGMVVRYTRKDKTILEAMNDPIPNGFNAEGGFYL